MGASFRPKADIYETFAAFLEMQITPIGEAIRRPQQRRQIINTKVLSFAMPTRGSYSLVVY
jgi:hypothetical protein